MRGLSNWGGSRACDVLLQAREASRWRRKSTTFSRVCQVFENSSQSWFRYVNSMTQRAFRRGPWALNSPRPIRGCVRVAMNVSQDGEREVEQPIDGLGSGVCGGGFFIFRGRTFLCHANAGDTVRGHVRSSVLRAAFFETVQDRGALKRPPLRCLPRACRGKG